MFDVLHGHACELDATFVLPWSVLARADVPARR